MVLGVLLDDVRAPPRHPPAGERRDERAGLQAEGLEHERGIELHVRPQVAAERGVLYRARAPVPRLEAPLVRRDVRLRAGGGVVRARHRAARPGPSHPSSIRVRRAAWPEAELTLIPAR